MPKTKFGQFLRNQNIREKMESKHLIQFDKNVHLERAQEIARIQKQKQEEQNFEKSNYQNFQNPQNGFLAENEAGNYQSDFFGGNNDMQRGNRNGDMRKGGVIGRLRNLIGSMIS